MNCINEITNEALKIVAEKVPAGKLMMVPMLLLVIDTEAWKFPPQYKSQANPEIWELIDFIENSEELKNIFQKKREENDRLREGIPYLF